MIFEKVREIVCEQFDKSESAITESTRFLEDLGADSLDVVELAVTIEESFGLPEIDSDDLGTIRTVGDLVAYVTRAKA